MHRFSGQISFKKLFLLFFLILLCAFVLLLCLIFSPNLYPRHYYGHISRAESEMNLLSTALEKFYIENNTYPIPSESHLISDASHTVSQSGNTKSLYLTTPYAYLSSMVFDPFIGNGRTYQYRYYSDGKNWYILASNGPDWDIDLTEDSFPEPFTAENIRLNHPSKLMQKFIYNASNGAGSNGDLIRIGP